MSGRIVSILGGIVILALWTGAATLMATVVAPAAFAVLPTRTLAGALVGRVLPVVFWGGLIASVIILGIAWRAAGRTALLGGLVMFMGCALAQFVIAPRIEKIRAAIAGPIDALDLADPRRLEFGRLHGMSVGALGLAGIGALITLVVFARIASERSTP